MRYLIVGGGVAGLTAAHSLIHEHSVAGEDVHLVEATDRVGGCLTPTTLAGRQMDAGPDALLTRRPEGVELLRSLGLGDRTVSPATGSAYLSTGSGLEPYPPGLFLGVPLRPAALAATTVLTAEGRARALEGFDAPATTELSDVSVRTMVARRWGDEVAERLAGPLIAAVHAGRADYLSASGCAPQLFPDALPRIAAGAGAGPPFVSLADGLWTLAGHLRESLERAGAQVSTGAVVQELARRHATWVATTGAGQVEADCVVLATGAPATARLIQPIAPAAAALLASIENASVAIATILLADSVKFPQGSGFLVRPLADTGPLLTACTWFDQKWPAAARPDGRVVRLSAGRHGDARFDDLDDAELVEQLTKDLGTTTGQDAEVLSASVTRFPFAFPQYAVGHLDLVETVHDEVARACSGTLSLCGNAYEGIGLPAVIASARAAGRTVAAA